MNIFDEAGLNSDITCSLYELAAYTASIESYVRGDTLRLDAQVMCDRRNLAQYNLMCIVPQTGMQQESALSEITRIATVIYSVGVTFPLAGVGAPFSKLVKLLRLEITDSRILEMASFRESTRCFLLWALVMGGITAEESDKAWYITVLANLISQYQFTDWKKLKGSLKMILWLDSACDMAGKELYAQLCSQLQRMAVRSEAGRLSPCAHCKARKVKCGSERPCNHCLNFGLNCDLRIPDSEKRRGHIYSVRRKPCELCRRRRVRCDKGSPCQRCLDSGLDCTYADIL